METPSVDGGRADRRWYPAGDRGEWARSTRQTVFESIIRCITHAIAAGTKPGAPLDELYTSDTTFRELHICVDAHARGLYALGQVQDGVVALILVAARRAGQSSELHPAIVAAIEQWCREAHVTSVDTTSAPSA